MAIPLQDFITSDQLDCVFSEPKVNHVLLISGAENTGKRTAFCDRIRNQRDDKSQNILVLTSSEKAADELSKGLGADVTVMSFRSLVQKCLGGSKSRYQIIGTRKVNYFLRELEIENKLDLFERMKKNIEVLSAVSEETISKMSEFETQIRFGLPKEKVERLKQLIGETIYLPYSQTITQFELLAKVNPIKEFTYVGVFECHNLMENEINILSKILRGKHATVTYKPTDIRTSNIPILKKKFGKNITEIKLTKVFDNSLEKASSLRELYDKNKIDPKNISQISAAILSIFNDRADNVALLQVISSIPSLDSKYITKLCDIASNESIPLIEFVDKYQDSFSEKNGSKLIPIVNYLNKVHGRLDKRNANSVMIHFLNFFKLLNVQPYDNTDVKQHLINMHMTFKRLAENDKNLNLIERYLENNGFVKSNPVSSAPMLTRTTKTAGFPTPPPSPITGSINGTITVNLPVSVNVKPEMGNTTPIMLRRSGTSKCKPRPRSWHAGNIINAARKLR